MIRRFNRYELKYIVQLEKAERIMADLMNFTEPDSYGGRSGYPLVSLYYDSPAMDFYWAKIEGIKFRRKLRIRIYPKDPIDTTTEGMVEIKQRINRTVQKRRLKLPLDEAEDLCRGTLTRDDLDPMDQQVASEVQYMVNAMHLSPTCITAYHRKAFIGGHYDAGLRITFDTNVSYRVHGLTVNQDAENHLIMPPDWSIMEVKVNDAVPDWVTSLLSRHRCSLRRVSKYCAGIALASEHEVVPLVIAPVPGMEVS
ncbi:MAG: polyphosphate polymerase domain-containing protein [Deltaproteobacteria bacterium]|nr:polyphosphate polymerase domain-containing protein [Deltaproteobacteria bacterium]